MRVQNFQKGNAIMDKRKILMPLLLLLALTLAACGGADEVAVVDVAPLLETIAGATDRERLEVLPNHLGMSGRYVLKRIDVGSNPRGAYSDCSNRHYRVSVIGVRPSAW